MKGSAAQLPLEAPAGSQLALFDQREVEAHAVAALPGGLKLGEIVVYLRNSFHQYLPFHQVRAIRLDSAGRPVYHIAAVPYGECPGDYWNLQQYDLEIGRARGTGIVWRVPGWDEIRSWSDLEGRKVYDDVASTAHWCRCVGYGKPDCGWARYGNEHGWHHRFGVPFAHEAELVELLGPLGDRTHWTWRNARRKLRALELRLERLPHCQN